MTCEYPERCAQEAELRIGFENPHLQVCRIHAMVIAFKLLLETPVPQPIGFARLQMEVLR